MAGKSKLVLWLVIIGALSAAAIYAIHKNNHQITLQGVVIRQDSDPDKQTPIPGVQITALSGSAIGGAYSDPSGFFSLTLPEGFRRRRSVTLKARLAGYFPVDLNESIGKLYLIPMRPTPAAKPPEPDHHPSVLISNVRIRYSVKTTTELDVGSEVKTFQVRNTGDVPCNGADLCSPDGRWKAADAADVLDAGSGNEFRNVRVSCIAGPCPFTRILNQAPSEDGRTLNVVARDWSNTATFLLEAEVVHPMISDLVRESYPVIFGPTLSFTLPSTAEGPSIEAEVNGQPVVFPLGPDLLLSWAKCTLGITRESNVYRCELKPGFKFK
ncbi:MAG: carboxypeptidase regulatory-like domain-containing protein [Acidobacteriaceae bacterium]|nr:carboxypeptidase regulatory-like domain-containing protein [Acidobacteriaceae bacterium]